MNQGMARKLRIQFAGAVYHVLDRGDRREEIFLDEEDRELFLRTLGNRRGRSSRLTSGVWRG
jgi:hypothetical protein